MTPKLELKSYKDLMKLSHTNLKYYTFDELTDKIITSLSKKGYTFLCKTNN